MNPNLGRILSQSGANPDALDLTGGQQTQAPTQTGGGGILDVLPILGGIVGGAGGALIPGLGETGLGEVGGVAAGQGFGKFIENLLTGQSPTQDVAQNIGEGAAGGVFGLGAGKLLGPLFEGLGSKLTGAANALKGVPTSDIFNSVVQKDPWMIPNVNQIAKTAGDLGYMDKPIGESLAQMPQDFANIDNQIKGVIQNSPVGVPLTKDLADAPSLSTNFENQLQKSSYSPGNPEFDNSSNAILARIQGLGQGSTDLGTIYSEKKSMGQILSNTFDKQARGGTLTPKEEANMSYFQALKDTLDQYGSPEIRTLNQKQNDIYDIAKAFGTQYTKQAGKNAPRFTLSSLFPEEAGAVTAHFVGANPLVGAGLGFAANTLGKNAGVLGGAGNALTNLGINLGGKVGMTSLAAGGGAVTNGLSSLLTGGQANQPVNQAEGENGNQSQQNGATIPQQGQGVQPDENGNYNLPALGNAANRVPQTYPVQNYLSDLKKYASNPIMTETISRAFQASQQQAQEYAQKFALPSEEESFMFNANNTNNMMNELRSLVQKYGGNAALLSPQYTAYKSATDPQFGRMMSLLTMLQSQAEYNQVHGRLTNFDLTQLRTMPSVADLALNKNSALAKLDANQKLLVDKYQQDMPFYGLNTYLNQGVNQVQATNNAQGGLTALPPMLQAQILGNTGGGQ